MSLQAIRWVRCVVASLYEVQCVKCALRHLCPGDERLERMGMSIEHRATNLGALAGMIGVLRTASYVALSLKRYERR